MSATILQTTTMPLALAVPCAATLLSFGLGGGKNGLKESVGALANLLRGGVRDVSQTRDDRARWAAFDHLLNNYRVGGDAAALSAAALEAGQKARNDKTLFQLKKPTNSRSRPPPNRPALGAAGSAPAKIIPPAAVPAAASAPADLQPSGAGLSTTQPASSSTGLCEASGPPSGPAVEGFRRGAPVSTPDMSKPLQNLTTADGSGRLEACGGDAQRTHPAGGSPRECSQRRLAG